MNFDEFQGLARSLFEEAGEALFLCDPESDQILDANGAAQRLTGFLLRDLLRIPVTQLFRSASPRGMKEMSRAFHTPDVVCSGPGYAVRSVQPDLWIPVNVRVSRLHVLPRMLVLITARNLGEQLQTCAELENREGELGRTLASVPHCLWSAEVSAERQLRYHWFSPAVERITGQPPDFFLGGSNRWRDLVHPQDQPCWERFMAGLLAGQSGDQEYRLVRADGTTRWVRETVVAFAEVGKATCLHGTVTEVMDRKTAEPFSKESEKRFNSLMEPVPPSC